MSLSFIKTWNYRFLIEEKKGEWEVDGNEKKKNSIILLIFTRT